MDEYVALARKTVETMARTGRVIDIPSDLPEEFYSVQKGVFVTIHKDGKLRGCVGTFAPTCGSIVEEIIQVAVWAARRDDRFAPIGADELDRLSYEVSLLETPKQIFSHAELDPERYGVILKASDGRTGLLLPAIEGIESSLHQIEIAAHKAGIDPRRDEFTLWRFTVTKHKEP